MPRTGLLDLDRATSLIRSDQTSLADGGSSLRMVSRTAFILQILLVSGKITTRRIELWAQALIMAALPQYDGLDHTISYAANDISKIRRGTV